MRSSFVATTGLKLARSPTARQQAARRAYVAVAVALSLLAMGVTAGILIAPHDAAAPSAGPFSYFPS